MPYKATIKTGLTNIIVGGKGPYAAGDVVLMTDEDYAALRPTVFAIIFEAAPTALNTTTTSPYA